MEKIEELQQEIRRLRMEMLLREPVEIDGEIHLNMVEAADVSGDQHRPDDPAADGAGAKSWDGHDLVWCYPCGKHGADCPAGNEVIRRRPLKLEEHDHE